MVMREFRRLSFISCVKGNFVNDNGENIEYFTVHFFPVDDLGKISDVPESMGVKKEIAHLFQNVTKGTLLNVTIEGFVKKPKVVELTQDFEVED